MIPTNKLLTCTPIAIKMEKTFRIKSWLGKTFSVNLKSFRQSISSLIFILLGSLIIFPIVYKLPMQGWDWFFFFHANNPIANIYSQHSAYPPYAKYIIQLFTWMDWRTSFSLLNSITIMTVALATWKNGGRYWEILLALTIPSL